MTRRRLDRLFARGVACLPDTHDAADRAALLEMFDARAGTERRLGSRVAFYLREFCGLLWLLITAHLFAGARIAWTDHLGREIRHAARRLRRTPLLTGSAIAMLAIATGGAAVVFALLTRVVLAPLPYPDPDRLIYLDHAAPGANLPTLGLSIGLYQQYAQLPSIDSASLYYLGLRTLTGEGDAAQLPFLHTTPSLGRVLGLRPALGRWFSDVEGRDGGADVVVLTHGLWTRVFNSDASVIGRSVRLDGRGHEVIGVLGAGTALPGTQAEFVLPLRLPPNFQRAAGFNYEGIARLAPAATVELARREQDTVIAEIPARFPGDREAARGLITEYRVRSSARPLKDQVLGTAGRTLWIMLAATIAVLLVAGANLATLFYVRAESRRGESALRRALGAHPWLDRLGAALEPMLVASVGSVLGLAGAHAALRLLIAHRAFDLPRAGDAAIDITVATAAAAVALVLGLVAGVARPRNDDGLAQLLDAGRGAIGSSRRTRVRTAVMAVQVAFATLLLIGAALLVQSARHLANTDPGFTADQRLVFRVSLPRGNYRTRADAEAFHQRLLTTLDGVPGVSHASLTTTLPLDGEGIGNPIEINGRATTQVSALGVVRLRRVSDRYFDAMAIPVRRGRTFDVRDTTNVVQAAIVNEAMARRYFPGADPIGREFRPIGGTDRDGWLTIVGVVGDNATYSLHEPEPVAQAFVPLSGPVRTDVPAVFGAVYVVRTAQAPLVPVAAIQRAIASLDPTVAMARPEPLGDVVDRSRARVAMMATVLTVTALAAVLLGLIGVYAVVAHQVAQRTAEIGVRMAFGADAASVMRAVAGRSGAAILAGGAAGTAVAIAVSNAVTSLVFGIDTRDAVTYVVAAVVVIVLSLLACWIPARRAARLDPIDALRR